MNPIPTFLDPGWEPSIEEAAQGRSEKNETQQNPEAYPHPGTKQFEPCHQGRLYPPKRI